MSKTILTQKQLKELLNYNFNTGIFTWNKYRSHNARKNSVAGSLTSHKYISIVIFNKPYSAHRLAFLYMTGKFPTNQVDHINHIRDDNKWENLRETTHFENQKNRSLSPKNTSGICGVIKYKRTSENKWCSQIKVNQRCIHLGYYTEIWDAICSRKSAEYLHDFHINHGK